MAIFETKAINDVLLHADERTLVAFDIDNTLIEPTTQVSSVAWFDYLFKKLQNDGLSPLEAGKRTYPLWTRLQDVISVRTVEKQTAAVVKQLHEKNIKTICLTARAGNVATVTNNQFRSVGIAIDANTIHDIPVHVEPESFFSDGVLYAGPMVSKGKALLTFFETISYSAERVLFIDDGRRYLEDVGTVLSEKNIEFVGIRYGGADHQHERFDPARAEEELREILTGKEDQKLIDMLM